jgi:hypothetical protein
MAAHSRLGDANCASLAAWADCQTREASSGSECDGSEASACVDGVRGANLGPGGDE